MADWPDQMLHIVRQTCIVEVRSNYPDLTLRQLGVLLVVYLTDEMQTVRGLAKHLNIARSVITRVLNRLEELKLVQRTIDEMDRRSVLIARTSSGAAMMGRLGATMSEAAQALHNAA